MRTFRATCAAILFFVVIAVWLAPVPRLIHAASTYYVSNKSGNWSDTAMWTPNGTPTAGDSVRIVAGHTVHKDTSGSIGNQLTAVQTATGTCGITGSVNLTGVNGTSQFLTELHVGDVTTCGTRVTTIASITDDWHAVERNNQGIPNPGPGATLTYRHSAIAVDPGATFIVDSGVVLTVQGDISNDGGTFTVSAGGTYTFDSAYGMTYIMYASHDNFGGSTFNFNGSSGSHVTVNKTGGSVVGQILVTTNLDSPSLTATYVDFSDMGDGTHDAIAINCGSTWKIEHSTFTRVGRIAAGGNPSGLTATGPTSTLANGCAMNFNSNSIAAPPTANVSNSFYEAFRPVDTGTGTITGARNIKDNSLCWPTVGTGLPIGNGTIHPYTITGNCFNRVFDGQTNSQAGSSQLFSGNLFVLRVAQNISTPWSFVGQSDTIQKNYYVNEQGPTMNGDNQLMGNDSPTGGTWRYTDSVIEITGPPTSGFHCAHAGGTGPGALTWIIDHMLALPQGNGDASCTFAWRGWTALSSQLYNNTLMTNGATVDGGLQMGCCAYTDPGTLALLKNNLFWSKTVGSGTKGYGAMYTAGSTTANIFSSGVVDYNAHYNGRNGTLLDQTGANGVTKFGYNAFRVTGNSSFNMGDHDVLLGSGSDESAAGPFFVDPTRNFATFDRAYLGHTVNDADGNAITAWTDNAGAGQAYVVGNTVSASTTGWYGAATVNYRCVTAHTSAAANATNGKPGNYTVATAWRTNWEFASSYSIRKAIAAGSTLNGTALGLTSTANYIDVLRTWVQRGWRVRAGALHNAGYDGTDIGCCGVQIPSMSITTR